MESMTMNTPRSRTPATPVEAPPPVWRSHDLLQGRPEVRIVHGSEVYRLRRTVLGKLILTK
jgi:hemin uptake protein HemP